MGNVPYKVMMIDGQCGKEIVVIITHNCELATNID